MPETKGGDQLERAMKEAVEAVEARERESNDNGSNDNGSNGEGGAEAQDPPKAQPQSAVDAATQELRNALEETKKDAAAIKDKWLRSAADLENFKKRAARERDQVEKFANERLLKDLLPVFDDLDRTLQVANATAAGGATGPEALNALVEGARMVHKKFINQLEKHGVTSFESVGQPFDPGLHEAVQQVHSETVPAGCVADEMRRGFNLSGRLLRPAMVTVSIGRNDPSATGDGSGQGDQGQGPAE